MFLHNFLFPFIIFASYSLFIRFFFYILLSRVFVNVPPVCVFVMTKCIYFKSESVVVVVLLLFLVLDVQIRQERHDGIMHSKIFSEMTIFLCCLLSSFQQIFNIVYYRYLHQHHHHHLLVRCIAFFILIQVRLENLDTERLLWQNEKCSRDSKKEFVEKTHQIAYIIIINI